MRKSSLGTLLWLVILIEQFIGTGFSQASPAGGEKETGLGPILAYVNSDWDVLTRSMTRCESIVDPKLPEHAVLYVPQDFPEPESVKKLETECKVQVERLPAVIHHPGEIDVSKIHPHGLLFLPNSYVVPGGRFNEMYGWDSYFIVLGLLKGGRIDLARGMIDNFLFEIEHYGTVLNANRTYYLTRSQPPFLTSMIVALDQAENGAGRRDKQWLARAYLIAAHDYQNWIRDPHLAGSTGLSRYFDFGSGPAPESVQDESGVHRKVAAYFASRPNLGQRYLVEQTGPAASAAGAAGAPYSIQACDVPTTAERPGCESGGVVRLSDDYYTGDRSMRESGFDISFRFGPYGAATHHYAPVCLNSLLYKTEKDLEAISRELGKPAEADQWKLRAEHRKALINQYLWDGKRGLFFDYDLQNGTQSTYEYMTTFYPLWAGLATPEQAKAVEQNLKIFERPGGLVTSTQETGGQWDSPYGWAPLELLGVEGLRNYGFDADANRVSYKFMDTVAENFQREGTIREKYDVVTGSSEAHVTAGYKMNVVGFGWTNGVFLEFLSELPKAMVERLAAEQDGRAHESPPARNP
jgi:alpha,alpha-trehalase